MTRTARHIAGLFLYRVIYACGRSQQYTLQGADIPVLVVKRLINSSAIALQYIYAVHGKQDITRTSVDILRNRRETLLF